MAIPVGTKLGPQSQAHKDAISRGQIKRWERYYKEHNGTEIPPYKRCAKCKQVKPKSEYTFRTEKRRKATPGPPLVRLESVCKSCNVQKVTEYRERLKEKGIYAERRNREYMKRKRKLRGNGKSLPIGPIAKILREEIEKAPDLNTIARAVKMNSSEVKGIAEEVWAGKSTKKGQPRDTLSEHQIDKILIGLDRQLEWHTLYPL